MFTDACFVVCINVHRFISLESPSETELTGKMTRRRGTCLIPGLFLTSIVLFYLWSLDIELSLADDHSRLLAEDMLRTACASVRAAMKSLFVTHEGKLYTTSKRNTMDRALGTKLERLQVTLDNFHHEQPSPFRDITPKELSSSQSVSGPRMHPIDICGSLAGKRITMIGGEHIYRLHVLFLQHRERAEGKPFPCPYHEFCTHHHICLPEQQFQTDILPLRYIKPPTAQELIDTESAAINYIVSDTLCSKRNETSREYTLPLVDPVTGIRLRETFWLAAARKANIVILGRGPLSAPAETYTGNWSFLTRAPDYMDKLRAASAGRHGTRDVHVDKMFPRSLDILNAAVHLTVSRFLPDVLQLLESITAEVRPHRQKRLIWPSSWCRLPGRGVARAALLHARVHSRIQDMLRYSPIYSRRLPRSSAQHVLTLQISALIDSDVMNTTHLEDPWTLLFNAQGE